MPEAQRRRPDLRPSLDPAELAVARYPAGFQPSVLPAGFSAVVSDGDEVTVVAPEQAFEALPAPLAVERGWRRVTFEGPLPWELVGFLSDVATRLAGAQIPFTSMSGYTTDHVLVRAAHAELALSVLSGHPPPPPRPGTTNP